LSDGRPRNPLKHAFIFVKDEALRHKLGGRDLCVKYA
jgi:hypothetical protein